MSLLIHSHQNDGILYKYIYAFLLDLYFNQLKKGNTCVSSKGVGNKIRGNLLINHVNTFYEKNVKQHIKFYSSYIKRSRQCSASKIKIISCWKDCTC